MRAEGFGGRGCIVRDNDVLNGVLSQQKEKPAGMRWRRCEHCGKRFKSRQRGDDWCGELCERIANPEFQANRREASY